MAVLLTKQVEQHINEQRSNTNDDKGCTPSFTITSFKFKEIGAGKWQHIDYDFSSGVSEHTKAAVNAITYPHHKGVSPCS